MAGDLGERVARVEEKTDLMLEAVKAIHADVSSIKISLAEQRGAKGALNWLTHLAVGVGGVVATLFTIKHGG